MKIFYYQCDKCQTKIGLPEYYADMVTVQINIRDNGQEIYKMITKV